MKASKQVFRRYGYTKVSMDDISKAAAKGRSTIYHYFKNKKEVFEAFAIGEFTEIIQQAKEQIHPNASLADNLLVYNASKLDGLKALAAEYEGILRDLREQEGLIRQLGRVLLREESEVVRSLLLTGMERGEIAKLSKEDLNLLTEMIVIALRSFEQEIFINNRMTGLGNRLKWLIDILIKGLQ
ncbi:TetR/AcrR family transcriptional regulator [Rufibacter sp. XAAS-G3-1]|uniref:TetR/AcrR family transcriptional regulator n=1 Tax=Rufibacter sp. XAAS-G3-1 TaxID=2729134 RepID=UPI0015E70281